MMYFQRMCWGAWNSFLLYISAVFVSVSVAELVHDFHYDGVGFADESAAASTKLMQKHTRVSRAQAPSELEKFLKNAYATHHVSPSMAAAFRLDLFKAIPVDGPGATFEEILQRTNSTAIGMDALLDAVVGFGAIRYNEDTKLFTNEYSKSMILPELQMYEDQVLGDSVSMQRQVFYLKDSVREGRAVGLTEVFGDYESIYEARSDIPELATDWDKWMTSFDKFLIDSLDFIYELPSVVSRIGEGSKSFNGRVLDWCGNTGANSVNLALADPTMKVTLIDLPSQVAKAEKNIEANGLRGQIDTMGVDLTSDNLIFEDTYDAVFMIHTIREWSNEAMARFFEIIHSILNTGGFVTMDMVAKHEIGEGYAEGGGLVTAQSLYFLTSAANEQYPKTAKTLQGMLMDAGFANVTSIFSSNGEEWVTAVKL